MSRLDSAISDFSLLFAGYYSTRSSLPVFGEGAEGAGAEADADAADFLGLEIDSKLSLGGDVRVTS